MKQIYLTVLLAFIPLVYAFSFISSGYIITKNGVRLTGQIGLLNQTNQVSTVVFINDFGNIYTLQPELIAGFVFERDTSMQLFESKISSEERRWVFMKVLAKGNGLNLYSIVTEKESSMGVTEIDGDQRKLKSMDYFLEARSKSKLPIRVQRMGFKRQMKELIQRRAPKLAAKIGSKGYRYRDILQIVEAYNEKVGNSKIFL